MLLSKASASFTELGWSAQLFLVREFCMFIRYLAPPVFICPMLRMEKYHVYPRTTLKNEVLQKSQNQKGNYKPAEGRKIYCHELGASVFAQIWCKVNVAKEMSDFYTFIPLSDRSPGAAGQEMPLLTKPSAKQ